MKKLLMAAAVIGSVVFFSSCNSAGSSDPKAVLISFFDALAKKDISAARKYATAESKSMLDMMEMAMKAGGDKEKDEKYDKSKMEFGEPKIDGDKATIEVKEKASGEATNFTLKKESGAWKVAFDKASMMNMGMDKMKEKGVDNMDMNSIDSLGNKVQESLDKIDENKDKIEDAMKKITDTVSKMNH